jgi:hypothetical protein
MFSKKFQSLFPDQIVSRPSRAHVEIHDTLKEFAQKHSLPMQHGYISVVFSSFSISMKGKIRHDCSPVYYGEHTVGPFPGDTSNSIVTTTQPYSDLNSVMVELSDLVERLHGPDN